MEQIVEFGANAKEVDGKKLATFDAEKLLKLLGGCEDLPVIVVSITGVFRSGKSFLLNLLVTYLEYVSKHVSLKMSIMF